MIDCRTGSAPSHESLGDCEPEVRGNVGSVDALDELRVALRSLSSIEQDILLRFHQHGESVAEISTSLQMAPGTVKSHLSRGRRKLAQQSPTGDES